MIEVDLDSVDENSRKLITEFYKKYDVTILTHKVRFWIFDSCFAREGDEAVKEFYDVCELSRAKQQEYVDKCEQDYLFRRRIKATSKS